MDSAVIFRDVSCKIDHKIILDKITLDIKQGNITGVLGPNGAGKTTLLSLLNGLSKQSSGDIIIFKEKLPVKKPALLRQRIGVVLQETALYEELTIFENLHFAASLYNVRNIKKRINEVLNLFMLTDRANQIVRTLSGGLQRRTAIARAFLHDPELFIIDEPTLGVDVEARHAIWSHLRLLKSKGRTIITATNYLDEALALCDTAAIINNGKLITHESPTDLISRAGCCLDIECADGMRETIARTLTDINGILRIDHTSLGLSVFLNGDIVPEHIMSHILKNSRMKGFRVRPPDLAEVFKILGASA